MRYSDEKYVYLQDVKEKKNIGYSGRRKINGSKSKRCTLPSDFLTKKEIEKMNGECVSYKLNDRMSWDEFKALPDDIKVMYINGIRKKYNAPDSAICNLLGVSRKTYGAKIRELGLGKGKGAGGPGQKWDKAGFNKFFGLVDDENDGSQYEADNRAETNEKNLDVNSPANMLEITADAKKQPVATPESCTFKFNGCVSDALSALGMIIGGGYGVLTVQFSTSGVCVSDF